MFAATVFDLDGLLIDAEAVPRDAWLRIAARRRAALGTAQCAAAIGSNEVDRSRVLPVHLGAIGVSGSTRAEVQFTCRSVVFAVRSVGMKRPHGQKPVRNLGRTCSCHPLDAGRMSTRTLRLAPSAALVAMLLAALSGCQITPPVGREVSAQVLSIPATRDGLRGWYFDLHPALRAGVTRADALAGRLARGTCFEPDPQTGDTRAHFTVTTLLPEGIELPTSLLVDVMTPDGVTADASGARRTRQHGSFVRAAPPSTGDDTPRCRPDGTAAGVMRIEIRGRLPAWEYDFAAAELARHDQFSDEDLATRSVAELGCRVEAFGDRDFMKMQWFARVPAGMSLVAGNTVKLLAGASENSRDVRPLARILRAERRPAGLGPLDRVACR